MVIKILICSSEFTPDSNKDNQASSGGVGNVVRNISSALNKSGYVCKVCSPNGPDYKIGKQWLIERFGGLGTLYFWFCVQMYFLRKGSVNFDIVWLHNPLFLGSCPFNRIVVTVHSTYYGFYTILCNKLSNSINRKVYYAFMSNIEKISWRNLKEISSFTSVGLSTINELKIIGIKNAVLIPNGVDISKFTPISKSKSKSKFGIPEEMLVFVSLGRIAHQKMPIELVKLFSEIKATNQSSLLIIVGTGELLKNVRKYVNQKKIEDVRVLGFVSRECLPQLLSCADFYLSTTGYESGQPHLALLESMACGLIPIIPKFLRHVIKDAGSGLASSSANEILKFLHAVDLKKGAELSRKYAERHDWKKIRERYSEFFLDLLNTESSLHNLDND